MRRKCSGGKRATVWCAGAAAIALAVACADAVPDASGSDAIAVLPPMTRDGGTIHDGGASPGDRAEPADFGWAPDAGAGIDAAVDVSDAAEDAGDSGAGDAISDVGFDTGPDTGPDDGAPDAGTPDSGFDAGEAPDCSVPDASYDYKCDILKPETCPGGICLLGTCIGPVLDEHRYDGCPDGTCSPCETADFCPADCATPPTMTGAKSYANDTTFSIWVHGFSNTSDADRKKMVFAEDAGCGGVLSDMKSVFGVPNPCGNTDPAAPNQFTKVEYYGEIPPPWMSQADADEIAQYPWEGTAGIRRYGLIVARYIRHKIETTGATHVNLACHSMGCYIIRHMIENDLGSLASENRFVRWFSSAGVIGGARLARLYDNPTVQSTAGLLGISQWDFLIMNPDLVRETTAVWDHRLFEGNNPLFAGMIIHHQGGTDPRIAEALNIQLLDLKNPGDEPNDGIMYTFDEFFRDQRPGSALVAPGGEILKAAHTYVYVDHMTVPETDATILMGMATLFHRRKARIAISGIELLKDRESHALFDGECGPAPAEVSVAADVRFDPYVSTTFKKDVIVHQTRIEHRSSELFTQEEGTIANPDLVVFEGPVLDQMDSLRLDVQLLEVDKYKRFEVGEICIGTADEIAAYDGQIPLIDGAEIAFETEFARVVLRVTVTPQY